MSKHDIPGVVADFKALKFSERAELMKAVMGQMETNEIKLMIAEIGAHAAENNCNPVQVIGLGFVYGVVIGILAEKYHRKVIIR